MQKIILFIFLLFFAINALAATGRSANGIDSNFTLIANPTSYNFASGNGIDSNFIYTDFPTGKFSGGGIEADLGVFFVKKTQAPITEVEEEIAGRLTTYPVIGGFLEEIGKLPRVPLLIGILLAILVVVVIIWFKEETPNPIEE